jgi:hypothetical protein
MADRNTIYNGISSEREPNLDLGGICDGGMTVAGGCFLGIGEWKEIAEPINAAIRAVNEKLVQTRDAVRVAYPTGTDRSKWINERIGAVDARVDFIRGRVSILLESIVSTNTDIAVSLEKAFTAALSAIPGIGPVISFFEAGAQANRQLETLKTQQLIQLYTEDIKELASIRAQLVAEYTKPATPAPTPQPAPPAEAPNPNAVYYWYGGAALLVLLLLYWRKHKKRS